MGNLLSFLIPKSNKTKCDSNECKAGPSERFEKDDCSMIKDVTKDSILYGLQSIEKLALNSTKEEIEYPRMRESFNISTINHGNASNNTIHFNTTFIRGDSINDMENESIKIADKTVTSEVFPNDKKVMKLIWKYLSIEDKRNCTLVCKRFNDIMSNMDCFYLFLKYNSMLQIIPKVSRNYKTLIIQGYRCETLKPAMCEMLKFLSQSVVDLTLDYCELDVIAFSKFLSQLPLLESLKLNIILTMGIDSDLSEENLPNLSKLKDFNIKMIESITLFDVIFDNNMIKYFIKNKNSLTKCIIKPPPFKTDLNSLHFDSIANLSSVDFKIFNCFEKLRNLELIKVNDEMMSNEVVCHSNYIHATKRYLSEMKRSVDSNESNFSDDNEVEKKFIE